MLRATRDLNVFTAFHLDFHLQKGHRLMAKSEHAIQNEILVAVSQHECTVFRTNAGKIRTDDGRTIVLLPKGYPDLSGFRHSDGKMFFIEVKNFKGKLRPDQIKFAEFLQQYPVLYGVARSVEDALEIIKGG